METFQKIKCVIFVAVLESIRWSIWSIKQTSLSPVSFSGPFPCEICGRQFNDTGNRKRHIECTHGGKRKWTCFVCGKSVRERFVLNFSTFNFEVLTYKKETTRPPTALLRVIFFFKDNIERAPEDPQWWETPPLQHLRPKFPSWQLLQVSLLISGGCQVLLTDHVMSEQTVPSIDFTSEFTMTINATSVMNVEKPSYATITWPNIRKYTLVQYLTYNRKISQRFCVCFAALTPVLFCTLLLWQVL